MNIDNAAVVTFYYGTNKLTNLSNVSQVNFISPISAVLLIPISSSGPGLIINNNLSIDINDMYIFFYNNNLTLEISESSNLGSWEMKYIRIIRPDEQIKVLAENKSNDKIFVIYSLVINNQRNTIFRIV